MRSLMCLCCLVGTLEAAHVSSCRVEVPLGGGEANVGSGAKVATDASYDYVVTAAHVVTESGQLYPNTILRYQRQNVAGRVIGYDRAADVAVIRTAKTSIPFHGLAADATVGQRVWIDGLVSGTRHSTLLNRKWGSGGVKFAEFQGAPRSGDSGGVVRNASGKVIGVLHSGGNGVGTLVTDTSVLYRRIPTLLRNILRVGTLHRPVSVYRPAAVVGTRPVIAPSQIKVVGNGCQPMISAQGYQICAPPASFPPQPPPPYDEGVGGEPYEPIRGDKGDPGPPGARGERGPEGPQGKQGDAGPAGSDAVVDYQRIIAAVVAEMPGLDIDKVTDEVVARLPPLNFQMADQDGPYGGLIQKRLGETVTIKHYRVDVDDIAARVAEKLAQ